ncbi:hypothetical protein [Paenibacillus humicola]|uniref:hypothetical protein n=1 Tax=Paenibacillus humicola TaxID=3110540 RepID=UPI00237BB865|nr:hypothetical protein [Paenibacillus humicola]
MLIVYAGVNLVESPVQFTSNLAIKFALFDDTVGFNMIKGITLPNTSGKYTLSILRKNVYVNVKLDVSAKQVGPHAFDVTIIESWDSNKKHMWIIRSVPNETTVIRQEGDTPPQLSD